MSRICQITGKKAQIGNNVSHSNRKTKRRFNTNLLSKKIFIPEENRWVSLRVTAAGLRTINKNGIQAAMKVAKEKGFLKNI